MKLTFRQGVVQHQTDSNKNQLFLQPNGQAVTLNVSPTPTIISFAHKDADYLYTEGTTVPNAWPGPFAPGAEYWLYWDLHPITGLRTFGYSTRAPIVSAIKPGSAATSQHWFDLKENTMKEWNGFIWKPVIRVFAAKYKAGVGFTTVAQGDSFTGTQAGLRTTNFSGALIFDGLGKAVKTANGTFFTAESGASVAGLSSAVKYAAMMVEAEVQEPIPRYSFVYFSDFSQIELADPTTSITKPIGMIEVDAVQGNLVQVITCGLVTNNSWNWLEVNKRIYVGDNGTVQTEPVFPGQPSVGFVVAKNAILIRDAAAAATDVTIPDTVTYPVLFRVGATEAIHNHSAAMTLLQARDLIEGNVSQVVLTTSINGAYGGELHDHDITVVYNYETDCMDVIDITNNDGDNHIAKAIDVGSGDTIVGGSGAAAMIRIGTDWTATDDENDLWMNHNHSAVLSVEDAESLIQGTAYGGGIELQTSYYTGNNPGQNHNHTIYVTFNELTNCFEIGNVYNNHSALPHVGTVVDIGSGGSTVPIPGPTIMPTVYYEVPYNGQYDVMPQTVQRLKVHNLRRYTPFAGETQDVGFMIDHPCGYVYSYPNGPDYGDGPPMEGHSFMPHSNGLYLIEIGLVLEIATEIPLPISVSMYNGMNGDTIQQDMFIASRSPAPTEFKRSVTFTGFLGTYIPYELSIENLSAVDTFAVKGYTYLKAIRLSDTDLAEVPG
jgi:hypothetical protein